MLSPVRGSTWYIAFAELMLRSQPLMKARAWCNFGTPGGTGQAGVGPGEKKDPLGNMYDPKTRVNFALKGLTVAPDHAGKEFDRKRVLRRRLFCYAANVIDCGLLGASPRRESRAHSCRALPSRRWQAEFQARSRPRYRRRYRGWTYLEYIQNAADSIDAHPEGGPLRRGRRGTVSIAFDHASLAVTRRQVVRVLCGSATGRLGFGNATAGAPSSSMNSCAEPDNVSTAAKRRQLLFASHRQRVTGAGEATTRRTCQRCAFMSSNFCMD